MAIVVFDKTYLDNLITNEPCLNTLFPHSLQQYAFKWYSVINYNNLN
jgi:hypothetical protein